MSYKFPDCEKFATNPGSRIKEVYSPVVRPDGSIDLKVSGKEDFQAYIQSFKESTDISFILAKLSQGDDSGLHARSGSFGDFTNMPDTLAGVLQMQIDAAYTFDRLPVDVKKQFNNDVNQFMAASGTKEWFDKLLPFMDEDTKNLYNSIDGRSDPVKESEKE